MVENCELSYYQLSVEKAVVWSNGSRSTSACSGPNYNKVANGPAGSSYSVRSSTVR